MTTKVIIKAFLYIKMYLEFLALYFLLTNMADFFFKSSAYSENQIIVFFRISSFFLQVCYYEFYKRIFYLIWFQDVQDPSIFVTFPLEENENISLVAWTTTPWTLPSNLALCVNPDLQYVKIKGKCEPRSLWLIWIK